jgi:hypothetical protein
MEPREARPKVFAGQLYSGDCIVEPYDPDRREVGAIKFKNGKTKRVYRQMRAVTAQADANAEWRSEYCSHPYAASYAKYKDQEKRKTNVRPEPNQADGSAAANIVVLESRASRIKRFHECQRRLPEGTGAGFACARIAG